MSSGDYWCLVLGIVLGAAGVIQSSAFYDEFLIQCHGEWTLWELGGGSGGYLAGRERRETVPEDSGEDHYQMSGLFQGKGGGWWRKNCCGDRKTINHEAMRKNRQDIESCFKETFEKSPITIGDPFIDMYSCGGIKRMKHHHICATECAMKKLGSVDADGKVAIEKAKEHYSKLITNEAILKLTKEAIDKCADVKVMEITDEVEGSKCNETPINFKHCMWKEIILSCPEEQFIKNSFCDNVRSFVKNKDNKYT